MSLNIEVSGRLFPGDWGESLQLYPPPDILWTSGNEGDKAVPATEASCDVFTGWNEAYEWILGTDGDDEVGDIHNDGGRPAFDRPAVISGLES